MRKIYVMRYIEFGMQLQLEAVWRIIDEVFDDQNWINRFKNDYDQNIEVNRIGKRMTKM